MPAIRKHLHVVYSIFNKLDKKKIQNKRKRQSIYGHISQIHIWYDFHPTKKTNKKSAPNIKAAGMTYKKEIQLITGEWEEIKNKYFMLFT